MTKLNSPWIALISLLGFVWLCHASLNHEEQGYTLEQRKQMSVLVLREAYGKRPKMSRSEQAAAMVYLYADNGESL